MSHLKFLSSNLRISEKRFVAQKIQIIDVEATTSAFKRSSEWRSSEVQNIEDL
jgi:hypothetical protein